EVQSFLARGEIQGDVGERSHSLQVQRDQFHEASHLALFYLVRSGQVTLRPLPPLPWDLSKRSRSKGWTCPKSVRNHSASPSRGLSGSWMNSEGSLRLRSARSSTTAANELGSVRRCSRTSINSSIGPSGISMVDGDRV